MTQPSPGSPRPVNEPGSVPAPGAMPFLVSLAVLLACPAVPFAVGATAPWGSPAPFFAALIVHLFACVLLLWLAWRIRRAGGTGRPALAFVTAGMAVLVSIVSFLLMAYIASAYGASGAWMRLRYGVAGPSDAGYLGALAAAGLTVMSALWLVVVMRRPRLEAAGQEAASAFRRRVAAAVAPAPRPVALAVTGPQDGFLRRLLSPSALAVWAAAALVTVAGVCAAGFGPDASALPAAAAVVLAPVPVTAWAVTQSLWRPDEELGVVMAALWRTMAVPFVTVPGLAALSFLTGLLPPVRSGFAARPWPATSWEGPLPAAGDSVFGWLGLSVFIGLLGALLAGLILSVAVVLPVAAFFMPERVIQDNMLNTDRAHHAANVTSVRALSLLVPLLFLIPGLLVAARQGSPWWWLGIVLIPVGLFLMYVVWSQQRVDHGKRARWGVPGISHPNDPPPEPLPRRRPADDPAAPGDVPDGSGRDQ
ncbi:hypothetical protein [Sediminivirga luteola]|uniref:hypothetical protein n=1 Tax=Sediminivirga luteola TaxID=1774748 RepID=UPI001F59687C|nr:hypothetical protein [Sediminivirga luteola]MCI2266180.1 hypothetical protein [Sediminivirga luteola]